MQPPTRHSRSGTLPLLLALTLALTAGCSDSTSPTDASGTSIRVSVATTGADLDPDGFLVVIDSNTTGSAVGVNQTIVVRNVSAGTHNVWLQGIAPNCVVNYQAPLVTVGPGANGSSSAAFTVSCFTRSIPPALASTQLLFTRDSSISLDQQFLRTRADGTGLVALGRGYAYAWSPDGQRIAFVRDRQIYRMQADGTDLVALGSGFQPAWSPDGQRIAFARDSSIYVMDANGAGVQRVTGSPGTYASRPTWSPDGRRLAFASWYAYEDYAVPIQMTVVSLDGTSARVDIPDSWAPEWSPDGSRIAYEARDAGGGTAVWTVAPDGSNRRALAQVSYGKQLAWSPDGKQIALGDADGIALMNADGSGLRVLTRLPGSVPVWSPDGQAIAFDLTDACNEGCTRRVFYVTTDGSTTGLLIENGSNPSWHK